MSENNQAVSLDVVGTPPQQETANSQPMQAMDKAADNAADKTAKKLFQQPQFLWLISGAVLSMLGDQFTLIALPWLVLNLTNDTMALGIVLALGGVPRALLILFGGAMVDRYSPKQVMMVTKFVNAGLLGCLVFGLTTGTISLLMIYAIALLLGVATAFSIPSGMSMLPRVVAPQDLPAANSMMLGIRQLAMFVGPVLAGVAIALLGDDGHGVVHDARGLAAAFAFDCASYLISAWTLSHVIMRVRPQSPKAVADAKPEHVKPNISVFASIKQGLAFCWQQKAIRSCFLYWSAIAFFIMGPIQVALPVLAKQVGHSANVFGILAGAHGAGTLLGMVISGMRPGWRFRNLGWTILLVDFISGSLFMSMAAVTTSSEAFVILFLMGTLGGFLHVGVFSWIQSTVPPQMLGRAMSLFMFIFMGIGPVSAALVGWLMRSVSLAQVLIGSGALLILIVLFALRFSAMTTIRETKNG